MHSRKTCATNIYSKNETITKVQNVLAGRSTVSAYLTLLSKFYSDPRINRSVISNCVTVCYVLLAISPCYHLLLLFDWLLHYILSAIQEQTDYGLRATALPKNTPDGLTLTLSILCGFKIPMYIPSKISVTLYPELLLNPKCESKTVTFFGTATPRLSSANA